MKCLPNASVGSVEFTHTTSDGENFMSSSKDDRMMVYRILRDWEAMLKIYHHAEKLDDIFNGRFLIGKVLIYKCNCILDSV